jgi:hypothetical protein
VQIQIRLAVFVFRRTGSYPMGEAVTIARRDAASSFCGGAAELSIMT